MKRHKPKSAKQWLPPVKEGSHISVHLKVKVRQVLKQAGVEIRDRTSDGELIGTLVRELKYRLEASPTTPVTITNMLERSDDSGPGYTSLTVSDVEAAVRHELTECTQVLRCIIFCNADRPLYFKAESGRPLIPETSYTPTESRTRNVLVVIGEPIRSDIVGRLCMNYADADQPLQNGNTFGGFLDLFTGIKDRVSDAGNTVPAGKVELPGDFQIYVYDFRKPLDGVDLVVLLREVRQMKHVSSAQLS